MSLEKVLHMWQIIRKWGNERTGLPERASCAEGLGGDFEFHSQHRTYFGAPGCKARSNLHWFLEEIGKIPKHAKALKLHRSMIPLHTCAKKFSLKNDLSKAIAHRLSTIEDCLSAYRPIAHLSQLSKLTPPFWKRWIYLWNYYYSTS